MKDINPQVEETLRILNEINTKKSTSGRIMVKLQEMRYPPPKILKICQQLLTANFSKEISEFKRQWNSILKCLKTVIAIL